MLQPIRRFFQTNNKGLTLIETVVAITVASIVLTVAYQTFQNAMRVYRQYENNRWYEQNVRTSWSILARDIRCAYRSTDPRIQFVGTQNTDSGHRTDVLRFVTVGNGMHPEIGGLENVEYRINTSAPTTQQGLIRNVYRYLGDPAVAAPLYSQEVAPMVCGLQLRYYDGKAWRDEWSAKNTVPYFVEITVTLKPSNANAQEENITTVVPVCVRALSRPAI